MQAKYGIGEAQFKPAFLYVERGPGMGQLLEVSQGTVVVGRASVADLRIQHPSVSRRHCQIRRQGEQFFVKDLSSQNGTFVNKQRIGTEVEAKPGDSIATGNALVRLRGPLAKGEKLPGAPDKAKPKEKPKEKEAPRTPPSGVLRPGGAQDKPSSNNALKVAIFAGALGFGLAAALAFALVKAMNRPEPQVAAMRARAAAPASDPVTGEERERLIQEAIARKMVEQQVAAAASASAEPQPEVAAAVEANANVVVRATPAPRAAPVVGAPPTVKAVAAPPAPRVAIAKPARPGAKAAATDDDEDNSAQPKGGSSRAKLLASYEKGNAEASLDAAKKAGDKELVGKLTQFLTAYDAANEAKMANNGTSAIQNFQKALGLDAQLSSGWSKYGAEIRRQLANLYALVGLQYISSGENDKAKKAFEGALVQDPSNARARAQLEKLNGGAATEDDQGSEAPHARKPGKKAAPAKTSIDDAFGD